MTGQTSSSGSRTGRTRQRHRLEIGYAYAKGTPIILLRTDFREWGGRTGEVPYNLMLTESAAERIELAATTVDVAAEALMMPSRAFQLTGPFCVTLLASRRTAGE